MDLALRPSSRPARQHPALVPALEPQPHPHHLREQRALLEPLRGAEPGRPIGLGRPRARGSRAAPPPARRTASPRRGGVRRARASCRRDRSRRRHRPRGRGRSGARSPRRRAKPGACPSPRARSRASRPARGGRSAGQPAKERRLGRHLVRLDVGVAEEADAARAGGFAAACGTSRNPSAFGASARRRSACRAPRSPRTCMPSAGSKRPAP